LGFKTVTFFPVSGYRGDNLVELLALLKKISQEQIWSQSANITNVDEEGKVAEVVRDKFPSIQVKIHHEEEFTKLITAGFQCIMHCGKREYQVTVEKLRHWDVKEKKIINRGPAAKNGDAVVFKLECEDKFVWDGCDRVILRQDDHTIAFGKLYG